MKKFFIIISILFTCLFNSYSLEFYSNEAIEKFIIFVQRNYCPNLSKKNKDIKVILSEEEVNKINKIENKHAIAYATLSECKLTFNPWLLYSDNAVILICHEIAHLECNTIGHGKNMLTVKTALYDRTLNDIKEEKLEDLLFVKEFHKIAQNEQSVFDWYYNEHMNDYCDPIKFRKCKINKKLYDKVYNFKKED